MNKGLEALQEMYNKLPQFDEKQTMPLFNIVEKELNEGEKAKQVTSVIFRMFINGIDINKVLFDISISDSFESFKMMYSNAIKEEYDLLKEVLL